jgi:hypothetical protein
VEWESRTSEPRDKGDDSLRSFIFPQKNPHKVPPREFALKARKKQDGIDCECNIGPNFRGDLSLSDNCTTNTGSHTVHFGGIYTNDTGLKGGTLFTGSEDFKAMEVEVFEITDSTTLLTKTIWRTNGTSSLNLTGRESYCSASRHGRRPIAPLKKRCPVISTMAHRFNSIRLYPIFFENWSLHIKSGGNLDFEAIEGTVEDKQKRVCRDEQSSEKIFVVGNFRHPRDGVPQTAILLNDDSVFGASITVRRSERQRGEDHKINGCLQKNGGDSSDSK